MDRLQSMKVFVRVAQREGFAVAGRELRMSAGAVSKHVAALEAELRTRLFDRTTRQVGLTEAGRVYLERCQECLQALEDADASVNELASEPRGLLRLTAPIDFGPVLEPVLARLMEAHPQLVIDLQLSNRVVEMVEEGIDAGIRVAQSLDGRYVARQLARTQLTMFGTPAYFKRFGRPRRPQDLAEHRNLIFVAPRPMQELMFVKGRRQVRVKLRAIMTSNHGASLQAALRRGLGLCPLPTFMAGADWEAGLIEPVLQDWSLPEFGVFAVYPHRRYLSP